MPTIQDLRADYPDLGDLDDEQLVGAVHQALYADLPREKVAAFFGLKPRPAPAPPPPPPSGPMRRAADVALSVGKGIIGVPEALVGMADLATGGRAGQLAESAGVRFKDAKAVLDDYMSPEAKAAQEKFQQSTGVVDAIGTAVTNPSLIVNAAAESLPMMGMGGAVARPLMAAVPRLGAMGAAAAGEGITAAGSGAEQIRQQTTDGLLTNVQSGVAAVSGAATGLLSVLGGKIAQRFGIADVDTLIAGGAGAATTKGFVRRVLEGAASEGLLEELPQSIQEQVAQNYALGKPLDEGVAQAAVLGALTGGAMGGAVNVFHGKPPAGPMQRAVETAVPPVDPGAAPGAPAPGGAPPDGGAAAQAGITALLDEERRRAEQEARAQELLRQQIDAAQAPAAPTKPKALPDAEPREPTDVLNIRGAPFTTRIGAENRRKDEPAPDAWRLARVDTGWVLKPAAPVEQPAAPAAPEVFQPAPSTTAAVEQPAAPIAPNAAAPAESPGGALRSVAPDTKQPEAAAPTPEVPDAPVQPPRTDAQTPRAATPPAQAPAPAGAAAAPAAGVPGAGAAPALETPGVAGPAIDKEWTAFAPETGTKGVPRAEMPQVKAEHRGALTQFLKGRGIAHQQETEVEPGTLKPTQAEFSPAKVRKAREFTGGDRAILVSNDGHVVDGHHQWAAALDDGKPIRVIRLDAPIDELLPVVKEFPSAEAAAGATTAQSPAQSAQGAPSTQFEAYRNAIRQAALVSAGMVEQIQVDERLADGEAERLVAMAQPKLRSNGAKVDTPAPAPSSAKAKPEAAPAPEAPAVGDSVFVDGGPLNGTVRTLVGGNDTDGWLVSDTISGSIRVNKVKLHRRAGAAPAPAPARGPTVIINRLGPDGLTDAERAAGKAPYNDPPAPAEPPTIQTAIEGAKRRLRETRNEIAKLEANPLASSRAQRLGEFKAKENAIEREIRELRSRVFDDEPAAPAPAPAPSLLRTLSDRLSPLADRAQDAGDGKLSGQIRAFTLNMKETDPLLTQAWVDEVVAEREKMVKRLEKQRGVASPAPAPAPKPTKRPPAAEKAFQARTDNLRTYFAVGNVVKSYDGGHDEVLGLTINDDGGFSVKVHAVTKGQASGQWVRLGKPQDARQHSTFPDARELKAGPVAQLMHQPGDLVSYTEGRADGKPFPNAPDRGVKPAAAQAAPAPAPTPKPDKAEIRPYRRADGSIGYEAVPIVEAAAPSPAPAAAAPTPALVAPAPAAPAPAAPRARPEALIAARKRLSVLESLRRCLG